MKILFLNEHFVNEVENPPATLVQIYDHTSIGAIRFLEQSQPGVGHMGGSWKSIMEDGDIDHNVLKHGKKSDFTEKDYDFEYTLISGNY